MRSLQLRGSRGSRLPVLRPPVWRRLTRAQAARGEWMWPAAVGPVSASRPRTFGGCAKYVPKFEQAVVFLLVRGCLVFGLQNRGLQVRVLSLLQIGRRAQTKWSGPFA